MGKKANKDNDEKSNDYLHVNVPSEEVGAYTLFLFFSLDFPSATSRNRFKNPWGKLSTKFRQHPPASSDQKLYGGDTIFGSPTVGLCRVLQGFYRVIIRLFQGFIRVAAHCFPDLPTRHSIGVFTGHEYHIAVKLT